MATTLSKLQAVVEADTSGAQRNVERFHGSWRGLVTDMRASIGVGMGVAAGLAGMQAVFAGITATVTGLKSAMLDYNSSMEQTMIGLKTLAGSTEAANSLFGQLQGLAERTSFDTAGIAETGKRLLAMGFAAGQVTPLLESVAQATAALGSGQEGVDRISRALGQMQARARVSAEEMLQMTEAGVPAWQILADSMGKSVGEVQKLTTAGQVASGTFIRVFVEFSNSRWGDILAAQSGTFQGALGNLQDIGRRTLGEILRPGFELVRDAMIGLRDALESVEFQRWAFAAGRAVEVVAAAIRQLWQELAPVRAMLGDMFKGLTGTDLFGQLTEGFVPKIKEAADKTKDLFGGASGPADALKGQIEGIKAGIEGADDALRGFDRGLRAIDGEMGRLRQNVEDIKAGFEAHTAPIEAALGLITRESTAIRFAQDDIKAGYDAQIAPLQAQLTALRERTALEDARLALSQQLEQSAIRQMEALAQNDSLLGELRARLDILDTVKQATEWEQRRLGLLERLKSVITTRGTIRRPGADTQAEVAAGLTALDMDRERARLQDAIANRTKALQEPIDQAKAILQSKQDELSLTRAIQEVERLRLEQPLVQQVVALKAAQEAALAPGQEQLRLYERQTFALQEQLGAIKATQEAALAPLLAQLDTLERQKVSLGEQRAEWQVQKETLQDALKPLEAGLSTLQQMKDAATAVVGAGKLTGDADRGIGLDRPNIGKGIFQRMADDFKASGIGQLVEGLGKTWSDVFHGILMPAAAGLTWWLEHRLRPMWDAFAGRMAKLWDETKLPIETTDAALRNLRGAIKGTLEMVEPVALVGLRTFVELLYQGQNAALMFRNVLVRMAAGDIGGALGEVVRSAQRAADSAKTFLLDIGFELERFWVQLVNKAMWAAESLQQVMGFPARPVTYLPEPVRPALTGDADRGIGMGALAGPRFDPNIYPDVPSYLGIPTPVTPMLPPTQTATASETKITPVNVTVTVNGDVSDQQVERIKEETAKAVAQGLQTALQGSGGY